MKIKDFRSELPKEAQGLITEVNKTLAIYLGYQYFPSRSESSVIPGWKIHKDVKNMSKFNINPNDYLCRNHNQLSFHYDWNWLNAVVLELFKRHKFVIYWIANTCYSWHIDDFKLLGNPALGKPQNFNYNTNSTNIDGQIIAVWECVGVTIDYIFKNLDPMIPKIDDYKNNFLKSIKNENNNNSTDDSIIVSDDGTT